MAFTTKALGFLHRLLVALLAVSFVLDGLLYALPARVIPDKLGLRELHQRKLGDTVAFTKYWFGAWNRSTKRLFVVPAQLRLNVAITELFMGCAFGLGGDIYVFAWVLLAACSSFLLYSAWMVRAGRDAMLFYALCASMLVVELVTRYARATRVAREKSRMRQRIERSQRRMQRDKRARARGGGGGGGGGSEAATAATTPAAEGGATVGGERERGVGPASVEAKAMPARAKKE